MSRSSFPGRLAPLFPVLLLVLFALAIWPRAVPAAERTVVLEHWTNFR